jgi:hypothetical protein
MSLPINFGHVCKWCKEIIGDHTSREYRRIYKEHRRSCCMIPWEFALYVKYIKKPYTCYKMTYDPETHSVIRTNDMGTKFEEDKKKVLEVLEERKKEEKRKAIQARLIKTRLAENKEEKEMYPEYFQLYQFKLMRGY